MRSYIRNVVSSEVCAGRVDALLLCSSFQSTVTQIPAHPTIAARLLKAGAKIEICESAENCESVNICESATICENDAFLEAGAALIKRANLGHDNAKVIEVLEVCGRSACRNLPGGEACITVHTI